MADKGFNGTTVDLGATNYEVIGASFTTGGADVEVTAGGDAFRNYVAGKADITGNFKIRGSDAPSAGDIGAVTFNWNDGTDCTMTSGFVQSVKISGAVDGAIDSDIVLVPHET